MAREQEFKECEQCGKEIEKFYVSNGCVTSREKRFCGRSCVNRWRATPKTCPRTNCKVCGKEMDLYGSHIAKNGKRYYKKDKEQKYCSLECVGISKSKELCGTCPNCCSDFTTKPWLDAKFCSNACYIESRKDQPRGPYNIENRKTEYRQQVKKVRTVISCPMCCNFFINEGTKKYCSGSCQIQARLDKEYLRYKEIKTVLVLMSGNKCSCCKNSFSLASYCFHHTRDKNFTLDSFNITKKPISSILEEFKKCELMCHNCHAIHHEKERTLVFEKKKLDGTIPINKINRRNNSFSLKEELIKKSGGYCQECGFSTDYLQCMSFHHVDPATKSFELNTLNIVTQSLEEVEEERNKCVLLCMNCHISKNSKR